MRRGVTAVFGGVLLLAGACAPPARDKAPEAEKVTTEGSQTRTVEVDWDPKEFAGYFLAYFPKQVTVRPGDTVLFKNNFTGEPHSVTMGSLVDKGLKAIPSDAGPEASPPPEFASLPTMLPEGPGDAHQNAVNPCYLDSGAPPTDKTKACPETAQPAFTGKHAYYNSGFLAPGKDFTVKLAENAAPGAYAFYCNLHGPDMSGEIVVEEKGAAIPSEAAVQKQTRDEKQKALAPLLGAYNDAKAGKAPFKGNLAGYGAPDLPVEGGVMEFIPSSIKAKAGEKVTWTVIGPHTITFNPPSDVGHPLVEKDGAFHLNAKSMGPAGGPGQPPPPPEGAPRPSPAGPPTPKEIDGGTWDGAGFRNTGFIISFPEPGNFFSYSITFAKTGSYRYSCLVHPAMTGTAEVA